MRSVPPPRSGGRRSSALCGRFSLKWRLYTRRTCSSWRRPKIRSRSRHSLRTLPTQRSAWAFAFGAWIGVRTISMPSLRKMLSKARLNFVSRSWIRKRGCRPRSSRSISRLRACWVIHAVSGLLVQAAYSTRRVPIETKKRTYNRRSQTVSTVNKSQARIVFPCWRRNDRQLDAARSGAGGCRRGRARYAPASQPVHDRLGRLLPPRQLVEVLRQDRQLRVRSRRPLPRQETHRPMPIEGRARAARPAARPDPAQTRRNHLPRPRARHQVKDVGEPCEGEPHARFDAAAGGDQRQSVTPHGAKRLPPTRPRLGLGVVQ